MGSLVSIAPANHWSINQYILPYRFVFEYTSKSKLESSTSEEVWEGDGHGEVVWVAVQVDEVGGEQEAGGGHGEAGREHDGQGEASLLAEPGLELQTNPREDYARF